jgi:small subunit ribosomal protein S20
MPTNKSTLKRLRNSKKEQARNKMVKSSLKTAEKKFTAAVAAGEEEKAVELLRLCYSRLDKARKKGVIKANKASNKKSRLAKLLNKAKTGAAA